MFLRLIETALRYAEQHADKMAIVTTTADARRVIGSGRMAVFLGSESGWDHEGDVDVLGAFYRLGLRSIQFATKPVSTPLPIPKLPRSRVARSLTTITALTREGAR
jgi:hypothetical protein